MNLLVSPLRTRTARGLRRLRRGFTLTEVMGATVLLAAVVAFAVPSLSGPDGTPGQDGDAQARLAVSATLDAEQAYWSQYATFAPAAALPYARIGRLQAVAGSSKSPAATTVSVEAGADAVGLAARGATRCWLARLAPTGRIIWATDAAATNPADGSCQGTTAYALTAGPGRAASPDRPLRLDA